MTPRRIGLISGWLVVVGALVWALHERQVTRAAEAEVAAARSAQQKVRAETAALLARSKRLNAQVQAATRQLTTLVLAGMRTDGARPTPDQREADFEVRRRARIELDDQAICRRLGLSAEAAQKLAQIQEEFSERVGDVAQAARDNHVDVMSPQLKPMMDSEETRLQQRIAEELGPDVAKAIANQRNRAAADQAVGQVAADLCFTDHPLSLQQADELEDALGELPSSMTMYAVAATQLTTNGSVLHMDSPSGLGAMQPILDRIAALQQLVAAHLTPEQAAIVTNRMQAAESYFAIGANAYGTWRAIRNGAPAPATVGLPHE